MFASIKGQVSGRPGSPKSTKDLQEENEHLLKLLQEHHPDMVKNDRMKDLIKQKAKQHATKRKAMENIIDSKTERLAGLVHGNAMLNGAEISGKNAAMKAAGRTMGLPSSDIDYTNKYKKVGEEMVCSRLNPPAPLPVTFGKNMRLLYFLLDENFLNAASYGATPCPVMEARQQWDAINQANPVLFRFKQLPLLLRQARNRLAQEINSDPNDTQLLLNANAATSSVLKSLPWEVGDRFLIFNIDYDATKLAANWLRRTKGVDTTEIHIDLPMTDDKLLDIVRSELERFKTSNPPMPKIANFCHVTSKSAWIFPAKRLTKLFHEYGISVIIDGAQAAGHLDLNVSDIGADWYLGTVHKWMYSCQGVAFLVTQPHKQSITNTLTVSYFDGAGHDKEFSYTGLQDFSTWVSVIDSFEFIDNVCGGMKAVREYCRFQAQRCVAVLGEAWKTEVVQGDVEHYGNMPIMPLPNGRNADQAMAGKVMGYLMSRHNITAFVLVADFGRTPTLCIRCSCQIYTDESDWKRLADAVNQLNGNYGALKVIAELGILPDSVSAMIS